MKRQRELYNQLLPELCPFIPDNQRATFDQNLKALQENDYTIMQVGSNPPDDRQPVPYFLTCLPSAKLCR